MMPSLWTHTANGPAVHPRPSRGAHRFVEHGNERSSSCAAVAVESRQPRTCEEVTILGGVVEQGDAAAEARSLVGRRAARAIVIESRFAADRQC